MTTNFAVMFLLPQYFYAAAMTWWLAPWMGVKR